MCASYIWYLNAGAVGTSTVWWHIEQDLRHTERHAEAAHNKSDTLKTVVENLAANVKLQTYASVFAELPLEKKLS